MFGCPGAVGALPVSSILFLGRDERVAVFVIVHLCAFEGQFIHADVSGEAAYVVHFVFVGAQHQKLENDVWMVFPKLFFPCYKAFGAVEYLFKFATHTVLFVCFLGSAVDGNDDAVEATFHRTPGIVFVEVMTVGARHGIQPVFFGVLHHVEKSGIEVGLSLKIKNDAHGVAVHRIDGFAEKIGIQMPCSAGESPKSGGAFRTTQVAGCSGFEADGYRQTPLYGFAGKTGQVIRSEHLGKVGDASQCDAAGETKAVLNVHGHLGKKDKVVSLFDQTLKKFMENSPAPSKQKSSNRETAILIVVAVLGLVGLGALQVARNAQRRTNERVLLQSGSTQGTTPTAANDAPRIQKIPGNLLRVNEQPEAGRPFLFEMANIAKGAAYELELGDGSRKAFDGNGILKHTYRKPGAYQVTLWAKFEDQEEQVQTITKQVAQAVKEEIVAPIIDY